MIYATDLAVESKKISLKDADYSAEQQTRFSLENDALYITFNGTQTYNYNGRPNDADNDQ
jgi:hypothetical protein